MTITRRSLLQFIGGTAAGSFACGLRGLTAASLPHPRGGHFEASKQIPRSIEYLRRVKV